MCCITLFGYLHSFPFIATLHGCDIHCSMRRATIQGKFWGHFLLILFVMDILLISDRPCFLFSFSNVSIYSLIRSHPPSIHPCFYPFIFLIYLFVYQFSYSLFRFSYRTSIRRFPHVFIHFSIPPYHFRCPLISLLLSSPIHGLFPSILDFLFHWFFSLSSVYSFFLSVTHCILVSWIWSALPYRSFIGLLIYQSIHLFIHLAIRHTLR